MYNTRLFYSSLDVFPFQTALPTDSCEVAPVEPHHFSRKGREIRLWWLHGRHSQRWRQEQDRPLKTVRLGNISSLCVWSRKGQVQQPPPTSPPRVLSPPEVGRAHSVLLQALADPTWGLRKKSIRTVYVGPCLVHLEIWADSQPAILAVGRVVSCVFSPVFGKVPTH